jgi:DivIVA domain-containing protein
MEREFSAEAVRNRVFGKPPIGRRGYDEDEVDAYLQVIAAALDGRDRLSANDVHTVVFNKPPVGKRGYAEEQVDAFLDAIEDQLRARRLTPCPEPEEDEQASVPDDRIAGAAPEALAVRDPGLPCDHQPAVVRRPGSRVRFVGVLMLYPDCLVHVRTQFAGRVTRRTRRRIVDGHRSVTLIPLDTVRHIEYPTRNPKTAGIAVITDAGEEYWFRGTSGENGRPLDFDEWATRLYAALGKLGREVPPPTVEELPSGPLPDTSPMGALAVVLFGLAAGAAAAAAYIAVAVASSGQYFFVLAGIGFAVGLAMGYGPPWMSRVRLALVGGLIGLITTAAAPDAVNKHYRDSLGSYSTLDIVWLAGSIGASVLIAAFWPLSDYDLQIFHYLKGPHRSRAVMAAAIATAGVVLLVGVGALWVLATPTD